MPVKLVLGLQHGDEGKGRIVDDLAQAWAEVIIRFQGGGNAGHTVYDSMGNKYVTHQLPVGILQNMKHNIIAKGCVINPIELADEINEFFVLPNQLKLSSLCPIIEPTHILKDRIKYQGKIGTTAKGIGPAYSDFYARDSLLLRDIVLNPLRSLGKIQEKFFDFQTYMASFEIISKEEVENNFEFFNEWANHYKSSVETLKKFYIENDKLEDEIQDLYNFNKNILLEGAQGSGLSIDSDNYPNVTSSYPTIGGALNATGLNHTQIDEVIGVIKMYKTKVGSGEFPSRCCPDDENILSTIGKEFGATTGRPRKCGWLDLDEVHKAITKNGVTHLCITKTDVFTHIEKPHLYHNNRLIPISRINSVELSDSSFKNTLTLIKKLTNVKEITFTKGPRRGQIEWNINLE
jgi:adenylosuccinate synthase